MATMEWEVKCNRCDSNQAILTVRLIPNTHKKSDWDPKYHPQIKATCDGCGEFIKFVKQDDNLIGYVNSCLDGSGREEGLQI